MPVQDAPTLNAKDSLIAAYRLSVANTAHVAGDVPNLLRHAYSRHFQANMPVIHDVESNSTVSSADSLESLLPLLAEISPLEPTAQALIDRARSILTSGPPLSMNVELADGEELPVAMHTLLQGTLWASIISSGADPDLVDRGMDKSAEYTHADKLPWFLCKKFFFTWNVAEKDCETRSYRTVRQRLYCGRLFIQQVWPTAAIKLDCCKFCRVRCPPIVGRHCTSDGLSLIAVTPMGLWGFGANHCLQLGMGGRVVVSSGRIRFDACPAISEYEANLPAWHKDRLVEWISINRSRTLLMTKVGLAVASNSAIMYCGADLDDSRIFNPVPLPPNFVPDHIMTDNLTAILTDTERQLIAGGNMHGQLGLGHRETVCRFTQLPFRVDRILHSMFFSVFLRGSELLFAGSVTPFIAQWLPPTFIGERAVSRAITLNTPGDLTGIIVAYDGVCWTTSSTTTIKEASFNATVCFRATGRLKHCLRDGEGRWWEIKVDRRPFCQTEMLVEENLDGRVDIERFIPIE
ncbi:hypothetical protein J8273_4452 [Carpediemonas membranifera]|uniref:Uncharacterized protein n=1 Tax=Carpediemonas membranifera TaxID=201153 RepID=A0A8J6DZT4_9EUKA|nr:hypothetical protein J8273_4452 [Carpediemonas membranifera]|eukprot:KAG9394089.1 hypothetical protein J8273_4452 [Carpediemonas membranifera]